MDRGGGGVFLCLMFVVYVKPFIKSYTIGPFEGQLYTLISFECIWIKYCSTRLFLSRVIYIVLIVITNQLQQL